MESKNLRVTFTNLEDCKVFLTYATADVENKWGAYQVLTSLGLRANSAAMGEARSDILNTLELLLDISIEFERLHVDCPCSITQEEVSNNIRVVREKIEMIRREMAEVGPVNTDPQAAAEDLRNFLTKARGILPPGMIPPGMDASGMVPGLSTGENGDAPGTGLYL